MEAKISSVVLKAIADRVFPGCVVGVIKGGGERLLLPFGRFTYDEDSRKVTADSIFDVASITKSIPTASLALKLIDEGRLNLEDKLIQFVPEFRNSQREAVRIWHLLTQTLDYGTAFHLSALKNRRPEEILEAIFTAELASVPGTRYFYTNSTSILLGLVVERVGGRPLDVLAHEYFFEPLRMNRTTFHPLKQFKKEEIVPTEIDGWRGKVVQGEVHDESAYTLSSKMVVGSAGLFSTVPDLLTFLEMLLSGGTLNGQRYFSSEMVMHMHTNQLKAIGEDVGLGWGLHEPYMGCFAASETFGKSGFTGCSIVCDPEKEIGVVLLSNYTFPKRKPDATLMNQVRSDLADIVLSE